jgi:hypothetical protein
MANRLNPDQALGPDQGITSNNGRATLVMQGDGNLVLYENFPGGRRPLWATDTWGRNGARVIMQGDGNLVMYGPGGEYIWDTSTHDNPGASLVMQDDVNAVVYATDGRPLWASNTWVQSGRAGFDPARHGFRFPNSFVNRVATIPGHGNVETRGRCGGMAYAALDYYFCRIPVPAYTAANFAPSRVPPDGHWLADYIYSRLMNSFFTGSATKFAEWTVHSDHETWFYKGVTRWTKEEEFPKLRARIDSGSPASLGLIQATNLTDIGKNHQVVAYGYDYYPDRGFMTVYVYDNNHPGAEVRLTSGPGNPHFNASTGEEWRGFFVHDYARVNPPVYTTRPPAQGQAARYGDTVKVGHVMTGRTLHSHAHNYGHPGTSGQQQVTAFEGADDNDLWRIKGPHGQPEGYRQGQPVRHGEVVRLEHVLTRRNLHSHAGIPSPCTGQQEVTCFGSNGIGDGNDNWRVEIDGGGAWAAGGRLRLVHVPTNQALHSHLGWSHPQWTMGQQEVTGFGGRDGNDWWLLLEIR